MRLDKLVLGFIVFSFMIWGTLFVFHDINTNYDLDITINEFNGTYNKINETYELSEDIKDDVMYAEIEGADQSWDSMVKSSYSAIRLVGGTLGFFTALVQDIAITLDLPPTLIYFAITAMSVMVIFGIIFLFFRSKG